MILHNLYWGILIINCRKNTVTMFYGATLGSNAAYILHVKKNSMVYKIDVTEWIKKLHFLCCF